QVGDLSGASRTQPHVEVNALHLPLEPAGIGVILLGKSHRLGGEDGGASVGIRRHLRSLVYRRSSFTISRAALNPDPPVSPTPGCVPDPHKYRLRIGVR